MSDIPPPYQNRGIEERLDKILAHMEKTERRERLRTVGGYIRTTIAILPIIVFLLTAWYAYSNAGELLQKITTEAARQTVNMIGR